MCLIFNGFIEEIKEGQTQKVLATHKLRGASGAVYEENYQRYLNRLNILNELSKQKFTSFKDFKDNVLDKKMDWLFVIIAKNNEKRVWKLTKNYENKVLGNMVFLFEYEGKKVLRDPDYWWAEECYGILPVFKWFTFEDDDKIDYIQPIRDSEINWYLATLNNGQMVAKNDEWFLFDRNDDLKQGMGYLLKTKPDSSLNVENAILKHKPIEKIFVNTLPDQYLEEFDNKKWNLFKER